ncbi:MAG: ATP-binding protein [Clostridiales Family XIII bacterium]|jgi:serine/threonine-protein kinase RsbW|nr:ATP-binding protein [Clostridiales Family XIII bacterium]
MSDVIKLIVPGKPEYVGTVRLTVSSVANKVGFDIEAIEDIKVAVSEACSNIICHGGASSEKNNDYYVICTISEDSLEIVVEDEGAGFHLENYTAPDMEALNEGGMGIFIIRALMDEVVVNSVINQGTCIRMKKYKKSEA